MCHCSSVVLGEGTGYPCFIMIIESVFTAVIRELPTKSQLLQLRK